MKLAVLVVIVAAISASTGSSATPISGIRTPTRNITCAAAAGALRCDIAQASYRSRLQARCIAPPTGLDWHGFELTLQGRGAITCSGGVLIVGQVRYVTLAYGKTWRHGAYTCTSRVTGLTCGNRAGHGLFLSRASWRAW
ncbi:MAG TPA: DUF6636 domain-containing protein [Gaiellaceae bacterium]|nr:DUF6636 domain-containing protein [Gaiellaceae bacterium]